MTEEHYDDSESVLLQHVLARLTKVGLSLPERPTREPATPQDVTILSPQELMGHFNLYQSYIAYTQGLLAKSNTDVVAKKNRYRKERALKLVELKQEGYDHLGKKIPVKEIEASLEVDEKLDQLHRNVIAAEQFETVVKSLLASYEAKATVYSRELTRRTSHFSAKES